MPLLTLAAVSLAFLQTTSAGERIAAEEQARLEACLAKIETDPDDAYEDGLAWLYQGNRPGARQCTAMALIALGHQAEAQPISHKPETRGSKPRIRTPPCRPSTAR